MELLRCNKTETILGNETMNDTYASSGRNAHINMCIQTTNSVEASASNIVIAKRPRQRTYQVAKPHWVDNQSELDHVIERHLRCRWIIQRRGRAPDSVLTGLQIESLPNDPDAMEGLG